MNTSYHDIKTLVLKRIRSNIWPPGANLPSEIDLAAEFGCARATVSRAMRDLVQDGILERKRKAGTKVKSSPIRQAQFSIPIVREEIEGLGMSYRYVLIDRTVVSAPNWLASLIGLSPQSRVLHLKCMHHAGSEPYQLEERWICLETVPDAEAFDFATLGPNEWLVRQVPFTVGEVSFAASNATKDVSEFLNAPEGAAIFTVERMTRFEGKVVTYVRLYFAPGHKMKTKF